MNKLKYIIFLLSSALLTLPVSAQLRTDHKNCLTYEKQAELISENPHILDEIQQSNQALENFTRDFIASGADRDDEEYVIPVVFHVIHNYGPENISDEQIYDQIEVFNEDFNALNPEYNFVHPDFMDIRADIGIEFRLAQLDPNGNCTNGIVRVQNSATYDGGENLKNISPAWDRASYLNIWVCESIGGSAAAYTYKPAGVSGSWGADADGIVCSNDYVGSIGTSSPTNSHTLSHEVGHWINLDHTWGPTNQPGDPSNCNFDDGIADTPETIGHTSCNINASTCDGTRDNVENYMEYAYCDKMFTLGQKGRMIAALNSFTAQRNQLWQPQNLIETGTAGDDVLCAANFTSSSQVVCTDQVITFDDLSYNGVTEWAWEFEGGEPATSNEQNPEVSYSQPGEYTVTLTAGNGDEEVVEVKSAFIKVIPSTGTSLPFQEGFEAANDLDEILWEVENQDQQIGWELTNDAAYSGDQSAFINGRTNYEGATEGLISQTIDLSGVSESPVLTFKFAHTYRYSSVKNDLFYVMASYDCGETWLIRKVYAGNSFQTSTVTSTNFVPSSQDHWIEGSISNFNEEFWVENFRLKFVFTSNNGNNLFIDDVNISMAGTTGIEDVQAINSFSLYPNPTTNNFNVELDLVTNSKLEISMYDVLGKKVQSIYAGNAPSGEFRKIVNAADLDAGIYFINIQVDNESVVKKLVVE